MKIEKIIKSGVSEYLASANIQVSDVSVFGKKPKFVPSFEGEYYAISYTEKQLRAECPACGKTGKLKGLDGKEYECPNCKGNWRNRQVVGTVKQWYIRKFRLLRVSIDRDGGSDCVKFDFECTNSESNYYYDNKVTIKGSDISTMTFERYYSKKESLQTQLTDSYAEAMAEIKRLNKAEKEKNGDG